MSIKLLRFSRFSPTYSVSHGTNVHSRRRYKKTRNRRVVDMEKQATRVTVAASTAAATRTRTATTIAIRKREDNNNKKVRTTKAGTEELKQPGGRKKRPLHRPLVPQHRVDVWLQRHGKYIHHGIVEAPHLFRHARVRKVSRVAVVHDAAVHIVCTAGEQKRCRRGALVRRHWCDNCSSHSTGSWTSSGGDGRRGR